MVTRDIPIPVPERAIYTIGQGEFAARVTWNVIDLDTGEVVVVTQSAKPQRQRTKTWLLNAAALADLRAEAAKAWKAPASLRPPALNPGSDFELDVIAGSRAVIFNPQDTRANPTGVNRLAKWVDGVLSGRAETPAVPSDQ